MFTESSPASLWRQQAANDCVFHETHHHVWYSSWNWSRHPNTVSNTDITAHFHHLIQTHTHLYQMNQGENANQKWYESLIQTSRLLWIRIRTSVLDSLPCFRQSFCQCYWSQAPPKQSSQISLTHYCYDWHSADEDAVLWLTSYMVHDTHTRRR